MRRRVPGENEAGFAVEISQPVELLELEAHAARIAQLGEQHATLDERDDGAVLRGAVVDLIGGDEAAGGRHVLHDDGRMAGDEAAEMPRRQSCQQVVAAADPRAGNEGDLFAGIERRLGCARGCRTRQRNECRRNEARRGGGVSVEPASRVCFHRSYRHHLACPGPTTHEAPSPSWSAARSPTAARGRRSPPPPSFPSPHSPCR